MHRIIFVCLCALLLLAPVLAGYDSNDEAIVDESDVVILTDANFDEVTAEGSWLVEFYAPWCGHCKKLKPIYAEAATALKGVLNMAKVDTTVETNLKNRFNIKSFPQIKFMRSVDEIRDFKGPRTVAGFSKFGHEMELPSVIRLDAPAEGATGLSKETQAVLDSYPVTFAFYGNTGSKAFSAFESAAYNLQGLYKFVVVPNTLAPLLSLSPDSDWNKGVVIALTKNGDNHVYKGHMSEDGNKKLFTLSGLREFIAENNMPLVSELGPANFDDITQDPNGRLAALIAVFPKWKELDAYRASLYDIAKKHRHEYIVATIDGEKYSRFLQQYKVEEYDLPAAVVINYDEDMYYKLSHEAATSAEEEPRKLDYSEIATVAQFLQQVSDGEVAITNVYPFYSPTRYMKKIEKFMGQFTETQVMIGAVVISIGFSVLMMILCVVMDAPPTQPAAVKPKAE